LTDKKFNQIIPKLPSKNLISFTDKKILYTNINDLCALRL